MVPIFCLPRARPSSVNTCLTDELFVPCLLCVPMEPLLAFSLAKDVTSSVLQKEVVPTPRKLSTFIYQPIETAIRSLPYIDDVNSIRSNKLKVNHSTL